MSTLRRLTQFVQDFTALVDEVGEDEPRILERGGRLLSDLVAHDDWLPDAYAATHPDHYQQYLLHCDPQERFSVVSFVWGPGHTTPIHDHTVWGLVGILRGRERVRTLRLGGEGEPPVQEDEHVCTPGEVDRVSPTVGDIHEVANADPDDPSISIHVYGANIGRVARHVYDPDTGEKKAFVSGYSNETIPNLWKG
jgi:predicted metal-dependent enzyme (double-stranded beta helix superfamily)